MPIELLTSAEMAEADRRAIAAGPFDGYGLMRNAGRAVARLVLERFPQAAHADILCGPGNNGGDGYLVASILADSGMPVSLWNDGKPRQGSDAERAAADCSIEPKPLAAYRPTKGTVIIDALYGAGLTRPLSGAAARAAAISADSGSQVLSIDLPSGLSGDGRDLGGPAFRADLTVTFVRKKPGHLLLAGRMRCGELVVADIGVEDTVVQSLDVRTFENLPELWRNKLPHPSLDAHKYSRGHVGVFSGGPASTGAARLAAMAAARAGAGAVTLLSPASAIEVNAAHMTSIVLRKTDGLDDTLDFLRERKPKALVFGPGLGPHEKVGRFLLDLLDGCGGIDGRPSAIVIDADGLTSLAKQAEAFLVAARQPGAPQLILTPHHGEFARLFPAIAGDTAQSKLERAREAARLANAIVVYKGPDTVIAAPDGHAAINTNGTPLLATAGSGDVLSGIIAGLVSQGMDAFEAACAGVWFHAEAARGFGPGLIAEDLPLALLPVLRQLDDE
jgi:hydroxyethylthiazole kinase-like uncharacterized protein yjeF